MSADPCNELDRQLSSALERKPEIWVAPGFATRVAARASVLPQPKPHHAVSCSQAIGVLCTVLLLLTMFILAPWTQPGFRSIAFDVELLAALQLIALSGWLAVRRRA